MKHPPFDKFFYYKKAVQNPAKEFDFFKKTFRSFYKKTPLLFREDFCGTFYMAFQWVQDHKLNKAIAIDVDKKPIEYGIKHHLCQLNASQKKRFTFLNKNILTPRLPSAELITVSNFSYFALKTQNLMLKYFKNVHKSLYKKGLFILDVMGGPDCEKIIEEERKYKTFTYFWDQDYFDPIQREGHYHIHFKRKGERKRLKQFSYNWRLWTIPELKQLLLSAGFSEVYVYWEQSDKKGEGNGVFKKTKKAETCDSWIAYLVSIP
ncbi:MAG: class I SAM-dependent methyltransferase [Bdellovibrionales bacterium]|nr:class I SAM-dependent methyltransferase [Bdellovibrionales bacterium]